MGTLGLELQLCCPGCVARGKRLRFFSFPKEGVFLVDVCTHRGGWKGFLSGGGCWVPEDTGCLACLSFHFCGVLDGQRGRWACLAGGLVGLDAMIGYLLWGQDPSFSIDTLRPGGEKSWVGGWEGQSTQPVSW